MLLNVQHLFISMNVVVFTFYSSCSESAPGSAAPPQDSEGPRWQQECESVKLEVERPAPESDKKGGSTYPLFSHDCENQGQVAVLQNKSGIALKLSK